MNKYFIIAPYRQAVLYRALRDEMNANGFEMTHDWFAATGGIKGEKNGTPEERKLLEKDFQGIAQADLVIFLPGGNDSFIEYGVALTHGVVVCIATPNLAYVEASHFNHDGVYRMGYDLLLDGEKEAAQQIVEYIKGYIIV